MSRPVKLAIPAILSVCAAGIVFYLLWSGPRASTSPAGPDSPLGMSVKGVLERLAEAEGDEIAALLAEHLGETPLPETLRAFTELSELLSKSQDWRIDDISAWDDRALVKVRIERDGKAAWASVLMIIDENHPQMRSVRW